jgi:hypothetical protein
VTVLIKNAAAALPHRLLFGSCQKIAKTKEQKFCFRVIFFTLLIPPTPFCERRNEQIL